MSKLRIPRCSNLDTNHSILLFCMDVSVISRWDSVKFSDFLLILARQGNATLTCHIKKNLSDQMFPSYNQVCCISSYSALFVQFSYSLQLIFWLYDLGNNFPILLQYTLRTTKEADCLIILPQLDNTDDFFIEFYVLNVFDICQHQMDIFMLNQA